jgi:3-carboxy-cis,cis-muconate cycloisomerase
MPPSGDDARGGLFDGVLARGPVRAAVSDVAWLQAMLDAEAALACAEAEVGLMPEQQAEAIAAACAANGFDVAALGEEAAAAGNPVVPLARALGARVDGSAAAQVHRGATSQDIVDTAAMLVARRALGPLLDDIGAAAEAAARLAREHGDSVMTGRTLLQQAVPITFALKAAGWLVALDEAAERLEHVRGRRLAAQLGGPTGTLASLGERGPEVLAAFARRLGLAEPVMPWHTDRTRLAELAGALGEACGAIGKVAADVVLLAQTEVAEVAEGGGPGRGGSSSMPHKHNPVAAVATLACARQAPGLVATLLSSMVAEHERAVGAWHAEWRPLSELLRSAGSAAAWLRDCLEHIQVDPERMRANLSRTGPVLLAERVSAALAPALGRERAQEVVREAAADPAHFEDALAEHFDRGELRALLEPSTYLGAGPRFVERALAVHAARPERA